MLSNDYQAMFSVSIHYLRAKLIGKNFIENKLYLLISLSSLAKIIIRKRWGRGGGCSVREKMNDQTAGVQSFINQSCMRPRTLQPVFSLIV